MRLNSTLIAVGILSTLAVPVSANATTNFDLEGLELQENRPFIIVSDSDISMTISALDGGVVAIRNPGEDISSFLGARGVIGQITRSIFPRLKFEFSRPLNSITFAFGDNGGDDDTPVIFEAFDISNNSLGTRSLDYGRSRGANLDLNFAGATYYTFQSGTFASTLFPNSLFVDVASYVAAPVTEVAAPVPEPATWTMFILGFGLIGFSMRRRQANLTRVSHA